MNLIWYLVIGYVICCDLVVAYFLIHGLMGKDDGPSITRFRQLSVPRKVFGCVVMLLAAPLAAPFAIWLGFKMVKQCWKQERDDTEYWEDVRATHVDLSLEPVHPDNLDAELQAWIEKSSGALQALDYHVLGTTWLKPAPFNSKAHFWLHPNGQLIVENGVTLDVYYNEILSFLDDGTIVSSVDCDAFDAEKFAPLGMRVNFCTAFEMEELLDSHQQFLQQIMDETGSVTRTIRDDNWKEYIHYQNQRFSHMKHEVGESPTPVAYHFPDAQPTTSSVGLPLFDGDDFNSEASPTGV